MKKTDIAFKNHLEEIAIEIESLPSENADMWIEENVVHIESLNELILTCGGPSIRVFIDCGVIKGYQGAFSEPIFVSCNTGVLKDYLEMFREAI